MQVVVTINSFEQLYEQSWAGARPVLDEIKKANKQEQLMNYLDFAFEDQIDELDLNDFIWFECDTIYAALEMLEEEE